MAPEKDTKVYISIFLILSNTKHSLYYILLRYAFCYNGNLMSRANEESVISR